MIPGERLYLTDNLRIEIQKTALSETIINRYVTGISALEAFIKSDIYSIIICLDEEHKDVFKLTRIGLEFFSLYDWIPAKGWRPIASKVTAQRIKKVILDKI